ncbi:MAG: hypothetical protein IPK37_07390 [Austwickia sp.]|jgi:hypothetical protein|nr:MAG: hypothetical protein IPK37_07390 [Austwickia sp.]
MTDSSSPAGPRDPLSDLAATPVERTASEAHPEAMPPVAGAADPQVLATGVSESPVASPEEADDAVRRAAEDKASDGKASGDGGDAAPAG